MLRLGTKLAGPRPARAQWSRETCTRLHTGGKLPPARPHKPAPKVAAAEESSSRPSSSGSHTTDRRVEADLDLREEGGAVIGPPPRSARLPPAAREQTRRRAWRSEPPGERLLCAAGFTIGHSTTAEGDREDLVMLQINFVMFLKMFQYFNVAYVSPGMLQCFTECFRNQTECFGNQLDVACNKSDSDGVEYH